MSPYNPYAGGYTFPTWWNPAPESWRGAAGEATSGMDWFTRNLSQWLNSVMPLMRTTQDVSSAAQYVHQLTRGQAPFNWEVPGQVSPGRALTPAEAGMFGPGSLWQSGIGWAAQPGQEAGPENRQAAELSSWLRSIGALAAQQNLAPTAPGRTTATRGQQAGFGQEFQSALGRGPQGAEAYAPWLRRLFLPTLGRRVAGTYTWNPEQGKGWVQPNLGWY